MTCKHTVLMVGKLWHTTCFDCNKTWTQLKETLNNDINDYKEQLRELLNGDTNGL